MLAEQRARAILQQLHQQQTISVMDLCESIGASEATIRRDLNTLAQRGRLIRVHGGAVTLEEEKFLSRKPGFVAKQLYAREKERIARYAASLVGKDDVVYLDTGTTVFYLADYLRDSKALFVTGNIELAGILSAYECYVYVLGGVLKPGTMDVVGAEALEALRRYNFTKAFLGTGGVSISQGFTTSDPEVAAIKVLAASQAHTVYTLVDSSKFGQVSATTILPIDAAKIITDCLPDQKYLDCAEVIEV